MALYGNRGIHGQTVDAIGRRVLSGELAEDATLDLAALQAEFGVSLTVMRESLKVLAAKGLVGARQKRGTYVRQRADWNLLDPDVLRWQFSAASGTSLLRSLEEVRGIIEPAAGPGPAGTPKKRQPRPAPPPRAPPPPAPPSPRARHRSRHGKTATSAAPGRSRPE